MKKGRKRTASVDDISEEISAEIGIGEEVAVRRKTAENEEEKAVHKNVRRVKEILLLLRRGESMEYFLRIILPTLYTVLTSAVPAFAGVYPFGASAVLATAGGIPSILAAAGAAAASLFLRGGAYVALASLIGAGVVTLISGMKSVRGKGVTVLLAVFSLVIGVAQTTARAMHGGITFYEVCGIGVSAAIFPLLTLSLRGIFTSVGKAGEIPSTAVYALIFTVSHLLWTSPVSGEALPVILSFGGAVTAAYVYGTSVGVAVGVMIGLGAPAEYGFVYPVAALCTGVISPVSPMAAAGAAALLGTAYGVYSGGGGAVGDLVPPMILCSAVLGPLFQYRVIPKKKADTTGTPLDTASIVAGDETGRRLRESLMSMTRALTGISSTVVRMSAYLRRPDPTEAREICVRAMEESCVGCDDHTVCWERENRQTRHAVDDMARKIRRGQMPDITHFPEGMRERCPYAKDIIRRISSASAGFSRTGGDGGAVFAESLGGVSRLMEETGDRYRDSLTPVKELSAALERHLRRIGIKDAEVSVFGKERPFTVISGIERGCTLDGEEIRTAVSTVLKCSMTEPEYRIDGKRVIATLRAAERFTFSAGKASLSKRGERCGDTVTSFSSSDGYFYTLISDGMGSGEMAAMTSATCCMFFEKLLSAGAQPSAAFEMLNSYLVSRGCECFATVDLMVADLVKGDVRFIKSGAAPSFVLRGGRLFRLSSRTVPVGIITPYDAEELRFKVREGDTVVMISDGVLPEGEEECGFYDLLCGKDSPIFDGCDPRGAAEEIAGEVSKITGAGDDISVAVIKISKK